MHHRASDAPASPARFHKGRPNPGPGYTLSYQEGALFVEGTYFTNDSINFSFFGEREETERTASANGVKQGFTFQ
jgi:hypothetical protein